MVQVPSQSVVRATRIRYAVLALLAALSMITYLDRVSFSAAQSHVIQELGLRSEADLKYAFMAFILAYSLFELPSSWWGNVFGPRRVLIRIVLWWSFFTAAIGTIGLRVGHGMVGAFTIGSVTIPALWTLVAVQFLFGLGEAGAYPNITRCAAQLVSLSRARQSARDRVDVGSADGRADAFGVGDPRGRNQLGPGWALPSLAKRLLDIRRAGGRLVRYFRSLVPQSARGETIGQRGGVGAHPAIGRGIAGRARPRAVGPPGAEREPVDAVHHVFLPILRMVVLHYLHAAVSQQQHGVLPTEFLGAVYKGGPLWMGAIGCLAGGFLTDWFIRRTGNRRLGRRLFGAFGHGMCALCFLACPLPPAPFPFPGHFTGRLLRRSDHGFVGVLPGHRPPPRRHRGRMYEHDRQLRGRGCLLGHRDDPGRAR